MLAIVLLVVVVIGVGVGVLAYRYRSEKGIESGISSFQRELHALAPREGERPPSVDRAEPPNRGLTVMGADADDAPDHPDSDDPDSDDPDAGDPDAEEPPATDESRDT